MLKVAVHQAQQNMAASSSKAKLDSLFIQWFSLPETQRLVSLVPLSEQLGPRAKMVAARP